MASERDKVLQELARRVNDRLSFPYTKREFYTKGEVDQVLTSLNVNLPSTPDSREIEEITASLERHLPASRILKEIDRRSSKGYEAPSITDVQFSSPPQFHTVQEIAEQLEKQGIRAVKGSFLFAPDNHTYSQELPASVANDVMHAYACGLQDHTGRAINPSVLFRLGELTATFMQYIPTPTPSTTFYTVLDAAAYYELTPKTEGKELQWQQQRPTSLFSPEGKVIDRGTVLDKISSYVHDIAPLALAGREAFRHLRQTTDFFTTEEGRLRERKLRSPIPKDRIDAHRELVKDVFDEYGIRATNGSLKAEYMLNPQEKKLWDFELRSAGELAARKLSGIRDHQDPRYALYLAILAQHVGKEHDLKYSIQSVADAVKAQNIIYDAGDLEWSDGERALPFLSRKYKDETVATRVRAYLARTLPLKEMAERLIAEVFRNEKCVNGAAVGQYLSEHTSYSTDRGRFVREGRIVPADEVFTIFAGEQARAKLQEIYTSLQEDQSAISAAAPAPTLHDADSLRPEGIPGAADHGLDDGRPAPAQYTPPVAERDRVTPRATPEKRHHQTAALSPPGTAAEEAARYAAGEALDRHHTGDEFAEAATTRPTGALPVAAQSSVPGSIDAIVARVADRNRSDVVYDKPRVDIALRFLIETGTLKFTYVGTVASFADKPATETDINKALPSIMNVLVLDYLVGQANNDQSLLADLPQGETITRKRITGAIGKAGLRYRDGAIYDVRDTLLFLEGRDPSTGESRPCNQVAYNRIREHLLMHHGRTVAPLEERVGRLPSTTPTIPFAQVPALRDRADAAGSVYTPSPRRGYSAGQGAVRLPMERPMDIPPPPPGVDAARAEEEARRYAHPSRLERLSEPIRRLVHNGSKIIPPIAIAMGIVAAAGAAWYWGGISEREGRETQPGHVGSQPYSLPGGVPQAPRQDDDAATPVAGPDYRRDARVPAGRSPPPTTSPIPTTPPAQANLFTTLYTGLVSDLNIRDEAQRAQAVRARLEGEGCTAYGNPAFIPATGRGSLVDVYRNLLEDITWRAVPSVGSPTHGAKNRFARAVIDAYGYNEPKGAIAATPIEAGVPCGGQK